MSEPEPIRLTAKQIFLAAQRLVELAERNAYLDQVCGGDAVLRRTIDAMLQANVDASQKNPLDRVISLFGAVPADDEEATVDLVGSGDARRMIGPYKLLEPIGRGGFGTVYMAEQLSPIKRKVAVKVLKPGMDSNEVIARFEAERQALAMMDHPNIAKILDGGTTAEGRPYFVMELVRGVPIVEYCDEARLSNDDRLELMIEVCRAVQHAHHKGIIHRDLKPSNVLVTMHDDQAVPKVIDFGIAKALHQPLTDRTLFTGYHQLLGTPMYMSPEQAQMSGIDVDTRSDVYSLGVLLYELLTGATPFTKESFSKASFDEIRKIILEHEPPRPSDRMTTLDALARSTAASRRRLDQRRISADLKGELDWIVMKALEKDRKRRYDSPSDLAADLERYLHGEAVKACPPSIAYQLKKFAVRNKALLTTASVVGVTLLLGIFVSTWLAVAAMRASRLAEERLQLADARLKRERSALKAVEDQRQLANTNLQRAVEIVDQMLQRVQTDKFASLAGTEPLKRQLFQDGIHFYTAFLEQVPEDDELRFKAALGWARVADLHNQLGESSTAQEARKKAISILEQLHQEHPNETRFELHLAHTVTQLGEWAHWHLYDFATSETALRRGVELWQSLARRGANQREYGSKAAETEAVLADTYKNLQRFDEAEGALRRSIAQLRQYWPIVERPGPEHPRLCNALRMLSGLLNQHATRQPEALELMKEAAARAEDIVAHAPESRDSYWALADGALGYANMLRANGQNAEAEKSYRRALEAAERLPRSGALSDLLTLQNVWRTQQALADLLIEKEEYAEAISLCLSARQVLAPGLVLPDAGNNFPRELAANEDRILNLVRTLMEKNRKDQAHAICQRLDEHEGSPAVVFASQLFAARAWEAAGEQEEAQRRLTKMLAQLHSSYDERKPLADLASTPAYHHALFRAGDSLFHQGKFELALPLLDAALRLNPKNAEALDHRGQVHLNQGKFAEALADLDEAIRVGPAYSQSFWHRAYGRMRIGDVDAAKRDIQRFLERTKYDPRWVQQSVLLLLAMDQVEDCVKLREKILTAVSKTHDAESRQWTVLLGGFIPSRPADSKVALALAQSLVAEDPGNQDYLLALGAVHLRAGNHDEALASLAQALGATPTRRLSPSYVHYFLALTEHHLGRADRAREHLQKADALAEPDLRSAAPWNRKLTIELLRKEATALIGS
ncbi:MAG: protein kinase [Pirellulales bacterium]